MKKSISWMINVFCLFALIYLSILSWHHLLSTTPTYQNDYATFYHSLRNDQEMYLKFQIPALPFEIPSKVAAPSMINYNTPLMNTILKLLVNMSGKLSINALIWTMASILGIGISVFCMCYYVGASYYYFLPSTLIFFLTWANLNTIFLGQVSNFILPILCSAFLLGYHKKWKWMTVTLALLASLKLFFLIFIVFYIARKEWTSLFGYIALFLIFFFMPLLYLPVQNYHDFFMIGLKPIGIFARSTNLENGSLLGFITKIITFCVKPGVSINIQPIQYIIIGVSSYILFRWISYYRNIIAKLKEMEYEVTFCFMITLSLLLSPLTWIYYYVFLLIPATVVLALSIKHKLNNSFLLLFSGALFFYYLVGAGNKILSHFGPFIDLLLWLICLVLMTYTLQTPYKAKSSSSKVIYGLFIVNAAVTCLFLLFNFGQANFL